MPLGPLIVGAQTTVFYWEETDTMDKIQQLRDEAAQVQNIQDYMAKLKAAQDALDASQKSAPKK